MGEGRKSLVVMLFLAFAAVAVFQVHPVSADVPTVVSIEPWTSGTDTILNITVTHNGLGVPSGSHYVDVIEVDIDGAVDSISGLTPQTTVTFVVQYNMGQIEGTPTVKARAHCTVDNWGGWSDPVEVPEFSLLHLLPILAIVTIAAVLLRSKVSGSKKRGGVNGSF